MTDQEMRGYLLGQATEAEAARLEERLLEDEETFARLRSVEDDLFDDYARGSLTAQERAHFADRYGADRGRLLVARALARRSPASVLSFRRFGSRHWLPLAAAAAVVAAVGATLWVQDRPTSTVSSAPAVSQQPPVVPAVLLVTLGTSRSATDVPTVAVPNQSNALELRVRLDPADRFDRYTMELRSEAGAVVWQVQDLRLSVASGEPIVTAMVPAGALASGTFELAVRGANGGAALETLGFATVRITRNP